MTTNKAKGNVLIADDNASILRLVQTVVEGEGFTVSAANDGKEVPEC